MIGLDLPVIIARIEADHGPDLAAEAARQARIAILRTLLAAAQSQTAVRRERSVSAPSERRPRP